jgi:putative transposase
VVERTFGWTIRWRSLVRDYEKRLDVSEAMIHVAGLPPLGGPG